MYHGRFKGTHYDAGYQHGKLRLVEIRVFA